MAQGHTLEVRQMPGRPLRADVNIVNTVCSVNVWFGRIKNLKCSFLICTNLMQMCKVIILLHLSHHLYQAETLVNLFQGTVCPRVKVTL